MIENSNFLIGKVPNFGPFSVERLPWWKEHKRRIFEGYWVGGKWMPPNLYQYVNFWHIKLSEDFESKSKKKGKPFLRDLEWEKSYILQEAKGFSGFELDVKQTCNRSVSPKEIDFTKEVFPQTYEKYKDLEYIPARDYLRTVSGRSNLGKPLYHNMASNVIDVEARGGGKSYMTGNNIGNNFLTDGSHDYDAYIEARENNREFTSETVVGAYDTKWSSDLLSKVEFGLENLEGGVMFQDKYYPPPLSRDYQGQWESGKYVEATFQKKEGGTWKTYGSGTKIQHRTFRNNPFAANGTRPNEVYIEEIGFMKNLVDTLDALRYCTMDGDVQIGMTWMLGTGGDMEGGSTVGAKNIFYNPGSYECLEFEDIYEGKGSIGLFIPSHMTLNRYKDEEGNTIVEAAKRSVDYERIKAKGKSRKSYSSVLVNRPEKPSEAFLLEGGNIFPLADIEDRLGYVESMQHDANIRGQYGDFIIGSHGKSEWIADIKNRLEPNIFPIKKGEQAEGCVVIWEHPPEGDVPYGMYVAATDPYDHDQAPNSTSVGSTHIMKLLEIERMETSFSIVAEYSGRPLTAKDHHERVRRLLMYYNARDLYENEKNTLKMHFEQKQSLHLLMNTPTIMKATVGKETSAGRGNKGIHCTVPIKEELELYGRDYLIGDRQDNTLNIHTINSIPLLQELKDYNLDGNFDRVDAFLLLILAKEQFYHIKRKEAKKKERDAFFDRRKFIKGNGEMAGLVDAEDEVPTVFNEVANGTRIPLIPGLFNIKQNNN